jgi:hypothetical protein
MKHSLLALVFFGLSTLSATADDGVISGSDLSLLGLGEMQAMSDVEGMKIRGLSGSARSASSSSFVVTLVDPFSGSSLTQTGGQSSVASDENAGAVAAGAASASSATQASTTASTFVVVTGAAANTFNAAVSILTSTTLGAGRSQAAAVLVP